MKTVFNTKNITVMKDYIKFICATVLLFATSLSVLATDCTYYVWDATASSWKAYTVQDQNAVVPEGPFMYEDCYCTFVGWHIYNPDVTDWPTSPGGYIKYDEGETYYIRHLPNAGTSTATEHTGKGMTALYAIYSTDWTTDWSKDASWSAGSSTTYTITFYKNDVNASGSMPSQTILGSTPTAIRLCGFTPPSGKEFAGWATSSDGDVVYENGENITITGNMSLYAKWRTKTVTITYNLTGMTFDPEGTHPTRVTVGYNTFSADLKISSGYSTPVTGTVEVGGFYTYTLGTDPEVTYSAGTLTWTGFTLTADDNIVVTLSATEDACTKLADASSLTVNTAYESEGNTYVRFSWTLGSGTSTNASAQKICFGLDGDAGKCVDNLSKSATYTGDLRMKLSNGKYWWSIQALGDNETYCNSNVVDGPAFCIDDIKTATPSGISATITSSTTATINWSAVSDASYYKVYVKNNSTDETVCSNTNVTSTSFAATSLTTDVTYRVELQAFNACDENSIKSTSYTFTIVQHQLDVISTNGVTIKATPSGGSDITETNNANVLPGTTVTLNYSSVETNYYWYQWNVYKTGDTSTKVTLSSNTANNATFTMPDYAVTVTANMLGDLVGTCLPEIDLEQSDGVNTPLLITGGYNLGTSSVEATRTLRLTIEGAGNKSVVTLSGTDLKFFKDNASRTEIGATNLKCKADGTLDTIIHVAYAPASYTDDELATPSIRVACNGNARTFEGLIKARCLPEHFVIAAKINGRWCALPADIATSATPAPTLPDAYPISVDNESAPRTAIVAPKTVVYGFSARNAVTSHTGGIRLDTKTGDGKDGHLQAPRSNSLTYMWRPSTNASTGMQDWYLTSKSESDFYTYNIGVDPACTLEDGTTPISRYLCVYGNKIMWTSSVDDSKREFRILPITTETDPVSLQVVEWKADKVVFMYFGNPDYTASVEINGVLKSASPTTLSSLAVDHGVYEIAVSDLMSSAYKQLYVIIKDGDAEIGRKAATVPLLVNTETTIDAARTAVGISNKADCQNVDLVVLNGGKLSSGETTDGAKFTFNSITVYGGGKLILPENNHLRAKAMYMRAGRVDGGVYKYVYPQLHIGSGVTFTIDDNIINYDYLTNYNQYFGVAFPQTLTIDNNNIFYPEDIYGSAAKTGSYLLRVFDSKIRAARGAVDDVWVDVEEGSESSGGSVAIQASTTRGLGYYVLLPPRKVSVNGGANTRQTYGIQRMKLSVGSADALTTAETSNAEISVKSYSSDQVYNAGWMMLANPYLADLGGSGVGDTEAAITVGKLGTNAQGAYEWQDKSVRYVTVPNDDASDTYDQRAVSSYTFPAFKPFYVQVGATGKVTFGTSSRIAAAPKRFNALGMPSEIATSVALNSEAFGDTTHILIGEDFTEEYEIGDDLMKMPHANVSLFTIMGGCDLFANALNAMSARAGIPVGYTAPAEGTYVFSVNDKENSMWVGNIWLTDYELNTRVDLLQTPYEFTTVAGTNKTRFALSVELRSPGDDTPTDIPEIDEDPETTGPSKFIRHDKMYIQYNGVIYDATGKKVKEINK